MSESNQILVRRGWWFWQAVDEREVTGILEGPHIYRARERQAAVMKALYARAKRESNRWEPA